LKQKRAINKMGEGAGRKNLKALMKKGGEGKILNFPRKLHMEGGKRLNQEEGKGQQDSRWWGCHQLPGVFERVEKKNGEVKKKKGEKTTPLSKERTAGKSWGLLSQGRRWGREQNNGKAKLKAEKQEKIPNKNAENVKKKGEEKSKDRTLTLEIEFFGKR